MGGAAQTGQIIDGAGDIGAVGHHQPVGLQMLYLVHTDEHVGQAAHPIEERPQHTVVVVGQDCHTHRPQSADEAVERVGGSAAEENPVGMRRVQQRGHEGAQGRRRVMAVGQCAAQRPGRHLLQRPGHGFDHGGRFGEGGGSLVEVYHTCSITLNPITRPIFCSIRV